MPKGLERALAYCLERTEQDDATLEEVLCEYPELRGELEPLLKLAYDLRALPKVRAPESLRTSRRPYFSHNGTRVGSLRSRWHLLRPVDGLVATPWGPALARLAACIALAFILLGGVAVASASSLPEGALYPVKLAMEDLQLAAAPSPQARMRLEMHFADRRLEEVETAVRQGRVESAQRGLALYEERIAKLLDRAESTSTVADDADTDRLQAGLERQNEILNRVLHQIPEQAQPSVLRAMELSKQGRSGVDRSVDGQKDDGIFKQEKAAETSQKPAGTSTPGMPTSVSDVDIVPGSQGKKAEGNPIPRNDKESTKDSGREPEQKEHRPSRGGTSSELRSNEKQRPEVEMKQPAPTSLPVTPTATEITPEKKHPTPENVPLKVGAPISGQPDQRREQESTASPATATDTPDPRSESGNGVGQKKEALRGAGRFSSQGDGPQEERTSPETEHLPQQGNGLQGEREPSKPR